MPCRRANGFADLSSHPKHRLCRRRDQRIEPDLLLAASPWGDVPGFEAHLFTHGLCRPCTGFWQPDPLVALVKKLAIAFPVVAPSCVLRQDILRALRLALCLDPHLQRALGSLGRSDAQSREYLGTPLLGRPHRDHRRQRRFVLPVRIPFFSFEKIGHKGA